MQEEQSGHHGHGQWWTEQEWKDWRAGKWANCKDWGSWHAWSEPAATDQKPEPALPALTDQEPEPALKDQSNQDHAADIQMHSNAIANLLKRGHTIDRLSSMDLTSLVAHIDKLREHREATEPRPEKRARNVAQLIEASPPGPEKDHGKG